MRVTLDRLYSALPALVAATAVAAAPPPASAPQLEARTASTAPAQVHVSNFTRAMYGQLFHEAKRCLETVTKVEQLRNGVMMCDPKYHGSGPPAECAARHKALDSTVKSFTAQPALASCNQDPQVTTVRFGDATVKAAAAGDHDAQLCYIEGQWRTSSDSESPFYVAKAQRYMKLALARGDWRAVTLLTLPSESIAHGGAGEMTNLPFIGAPFTVYRANRLLEFGATGEYLARVRSEAQDAMRDLSPAQIRNAREWAREEFERHFTHSPKLTAAPTPCVIRYDPRKDG